jgi:2-dehydro-3-deoxyphosphogluconate aldolase/(4S)-4-hydroxy-2-oxoglutarate aldolase
MSERLVQFLRKNRVIPVASFENTEQAVMTAGLALENSFSIIEITMRTDAAADSIAAIAKRYPEMTVGAGSVISADLYERARDAGARFFVSPGLDNEVIALAESDGYPFIPGIATPTELMTALKTSSVIKIFPSSHLGGPDYIKAVAAPFHSIDFFLVPTGGVNENNFISYLKTERVLACGMSYIVDSGLVKKNDSAGLAERMKKVSLELSALSPL